MEKKIGEIFEYNGAWYQCVVAIQGCRECSFHTQDYCTRHSECISTERSDQTSVTFKKLEKVGEPIKFGKKLMQNYKVFVEPYIPKELEYFTIKSARDLTILIEIKQNKENMEEEREYSEEEFKNNPRFQHHKPIEQVIDMKKVKPFDLQKAKDGKPVCARDGRKARIICFDVNNDKPIVAVICRKDGKETYPYTFYPNGLNMDNNVFSNTDLMMLPEKKEGWINICINLTTNKTELDTKDIYNTKEEALQNLSSMTYVTTVKIEWEE